MGAIDASFPQKSERKAYMSWTGLAIEIIALIGLMYFFTSKTSLDKGIVKYLIGVVMLGGVVLLPMIWLTRLLQIVVIFVYLVFYDQKQFKEELKWFIPVISIYFALSFFTLSWLTNDIFLIGLLWGILSLNLETVVLLSCVSTLILFLPSSATTNLLILFIMIIVDQSRSNLERRFQFSYDSFQRSLINEQYQEIKNVYLQMRGWRHDYHNHIQTMKAYLSMKEFDKLDDYFNELQSSLDSVDTVIKSGNIMMDAILNSKISIMNKECIPVNCKAILPEKLTINDIDLCVISGNLLDNAIEACRGIPIEKRFIRIFTEIAGSQFYLSIQNSATEQIDFNQKNYISSKRGDHGFGMKRVSLLVDKYSGYLNLQNEPGIFASEIIIPIN